MPRPQQPPETDRSVSSSHRPNSGINPDRRRPPLGIAAAGASLTAYALGTLLYVNLFRDNLCIRNEPSCDHLLGVDFSPVLIRAGELIFSSFALLPVGLALVIAAVFRLANFDASIPWPVLRVVTTASLGTMLATITGLVFGAVEGIDPLAVTLIFFLVGLWCSAVGSIIFELSRRSWIRLTIAVVPAVALAVIGLLA